jgi:hypothetical protein
MKTPNRDLLVLVKDECCDKRSIQTELEQLNQLLFYFETLENFCLAHEVFDMNRYKILHEPGIIQKLINQKQVKPFVFICNKN